MGESHKLLLMNKTFFNFINRLHECAAADAVLFSGPGFSCRLLPEKTINMHCNNVDTLNAKFYALKYFSPGNLVYLLSRMQVMFRRSPSGWLSSLAK